VSSGTPLLIIVRDAGSEFDSMAEFFAEGSFGSIQGSICCRAPHSQDVGYLLSAQPINVAQLNHVTLPWVKSLKCRHQFGTEIIVNWLESGSVGEGVSGAFWPACSPPMFISTSKPNTCVQPGSKASTVAPKLA
jgi:hypothetical protein